MWARNEESAGADVCAPYVSIVIPAYNVSMTICAALESVMAQSIFERRGHCPAEVVVVDDASEDNTLEVVRDWLLARGYRDDVSVESGELWRPAISRADEQPTVLLLRHAANLGPAAARNFGIAATAAPWIAFLDADDIWLPWRLGVQFEYATLHQDVQFLCGMVRQFDGLGEPPRQPEHPPGESGMLPATVFSLSSFAVRNPVTLSTVLLRRKALSAQGGFDEAFRGPEDYDMWMRVAGLTTCHRLGVVLAWYRLVDGSLSQDERRFLPQVMRVLAKAYGKKGTLHGRPGYRKAVAYQYLGAAWMAAERGDYASAIRLCILSILRWPFSFTPQVGLSWGRAKMFATIFRSIREGG